MHLNFYLIHLVITMVGSVDKLMILTYNIVLAGGACYLVYYKDSSGWLCVMALLLAASFSEKSKKDD